MNSIKLSIISIFFFVFIIQVYSQAEVSGCCTNPGADVLTCSTNLILEGDCCPTPVEDNSGYYDTSVGGPANYDDCVDDFFFSGSEISPLR